MSDAVRRALRTFLQAFIGTFLTMFLGVYLTPGVLPDVAVLQRIGIAAAVAGIIALLTFTQNWLEDNTKTPALLKAPTSPGLNPVPDSIRKLEQPNPPAA